MAFNIGWPLRVTSEIPWRAQGHRGRSREGNRFHYLLAALQSEASRLACVQHSNAVTHPYRTHARGDTSHQRGDTSVVYVYEGGNNCHRNDLSPDARGELTGLYSIKQCCDTTVLCVCGTLRVLSRRRPAPPSPQLSEAPNAFTQWPRPSRVLTCVTCV